MDTNNVLLIIMDGWGLAEEEKASAIHQAKTPFFDKIWAESPHMRLQASGLPVGLPDGQMGNSEVGHMNIGAGRIVYQDLVRINQEMESGNFARNPEFQKMVAYCESQQKPVHILGLLSDGGVHSSIEHIKGILKALAGTRIPGVYFHCFTDGRDTAPESGAGFVEALEGAINETKTGKIASIIGRYYAMDRDKRWPRVKKAYDLLVKGEGTPATDPVQAVKDAYAAGKTDEFIDPVVIESDGAPVATLEEGDAVLFFNFRTDRGRQLTHVLTQEDMPEEGMNTLPLYYVTMTRYDATFKGIHVLYEKEELKNGLGEYLSQQGKTQIRIAETEKYPHVTFFFNGGREKPMEGEQHLLCPSPKVATYDLQPEMSAADIRDKILPEIRQRTADFICLNFANPDMVGHTGVFDAAVKACETVDQCTQVVAQEAVKAGYRVLITADHGNADKMFESNGNPHTAHTTALVPLILLDPSGDFTLNAEQVGKLGDLAPTILTLMGMPIPPAMTGDILVHRSAVAHS